jgi:hypothetical protein
MIAHSIPFKDQYAMFWNALDADAEGDISIGVAYNGDDLTSWMSNEKFDGATKENASFIPHLHVYSSPSWSIATQLNAELSRFCLHSPCPDTGFSNHPWRRLITCYNYRT